MSFQFRQGHRVFVYREYVDMRSGFNKLSMYVREKLNSRIVEGDLYLFFGKNRRRIKAVCYDGTGLVMIVKRMEHGKLMRLDEIEWSEITVEELQLIFNGGVITRKRFGEAALTKQYNFGNLISHEADSSRDKR